MSEKAIKMVRDRIAYCLKRLDEEFGIEKIENIEKFRNLKAMGLDFTIDQYLIRGIGNMLVMYADAEGPMQMATITITPYFRNMPLYTTDTIYNGDNRVLLNEVYDLVDYKDDLYLSYIEKFRKNMDICKDIPNLPPTPCWYDDLRPTYVAKAASAADDDKIMAICNENLEVFIQMAKESPLLDDEKKAKKWVHCDDYARKLVEIGGVSTDVFKKELGEEMMKSFFGSVFFAPDYFKNL